MNRNTILVLIALLLAAATWLYLRQQTGSKTTLAGADRQFAVKDTQSVARVFLVDRQGGTINLRRSGSGWLINDQFPARQTAINNLLDAIARLDILYKPANAAVSTLIKNLSTEGIKVEIYDRKDQLMKAYYIGGSTADERGTYIILEGFEQPYVGGIQGWVGNVRFRYNLPVDDWRDRHVFRAEVEEIASVSVEYPQQRSKSFRLSRAQNGEFAVVPFYDITPRIQRPLSQGKIEQFLIGFESVQASRYINDLSQRDSIQRMDPFSIIELTKTDGNVVKAVMHPTFIDPAIDEKTGKIVYSDYIPAYYVSLPEGDFLSVQQEVISKLFWDYSFFFE
jgi:hypothetical protein